MPGFIDRFEFSQGDKVRILWRVGIIAAILLTGMFGVYVWAAYHQLDSAFLQQEHFVPTRIYSDITKIAPPQQRGQVEEKLGNLGYSFQKTENSIRFKLRPIDYPIFLLPDNHPTLDAADQWVSLQFENDKKDAALQFIRIKDLEIPEIFLEPSLVATLSRGSSKEIRDLMKFDDIPSLIWRAIIAVEDQNFLEHKGLDPRGIARAIWVNLRTASLAQGGSTITQQLVKNLLARRTKNIFRKGNELFLALLLEAKYSKQQILERYLNEVYLGQVGSLEVHGVSEGAQHFFGKRLDELNLAEIALMAGLIRGPGFYSPYRHKERAIERQRIVLKKMVETGKIAEAEAQAALSQPVRLAPPQNSANRAPFFTDFVKAELIRLLKDRMSEQEISSAGFRVYTTLDLHLNNSAQDAVTQGLVGVEKRYKVGTTTPLEGALAAVDHTTGYIKALVGGRNYAQSNFNRILNMKRQIGSTFKPFVYLTAISRNADADGIVYGPGHPIEDAPWKLTYDNGKQEWAPKNYEKTFAGKISYRKALAHSINTAAAKLAMEVGLENIIQTARALGIESPLPEVPSLSLGVAELSPVELLRAYATIANHGTLNQLTVIRGITQNDVTYKRMFLQQQQAFPPGPTDLITDMLQTVFTEGTARDAAKLGFTYPAAGKTGTTSNHRDAWFAGYTPKFTAVAWVGLDHDGNGTKEEKKIQLTGAGAALPIWASFMKAAHKGEPMTAFPTSTYLSMVRVDPTNGRPASNDCPDNLTVIEKYLSGIDLGRPSCEGKAW